MKILFQGDSITDAGRYRDSELRSYALGTGFPVLVASIMGEKYPDRDLQFYNLGISGHKITDLLARWRADEVNREPDVLVLLIGINDIWHESSFGNGTDEDVFEEVYRMLLEKAYDANPELKVILIEPFCTPDFGVVLPDWPHKVYRETRIIRRVADDFQVDAVIPAQDIFDEAQKKAGPGHWSHDGVHPNPAGHMLLAKAVMAELEKLMDE